MKTNSFTIYELGFTNWDLRIGIYEFKKYLCQLKQKNI